MNKQTENDPPVRCSAWLGGESRYSKAECASLMGLPSGASIEDDDGAKQSHLLRRDGVLAKLGHRIGELADAALAKWRPLKRKRIWLVDEAGRPARPQKTLAKILNWIGFRGHTRVLPPNDPSSATGDPKL